jgi:hypothetical protein
MFQMASLPSITHSILYKTYTNGTERLLIVKNQFLEVSEAFFSLLGGKYLAIYSQAVGPSNGIAGNRLI